MNYKKTVPDFTRYGPLDGPSGSKINFQFNLGMLLEALHSTTGLGDLRRKIRIEYEVIKRRSRKKLYAVITKDWTVAYLLKLWKKKRKKDFSLADFKEYERELIHLWCSRKNIL